MEFINNEENKKYWETDRKRECIGKLVITDGEVCCVADILEGSSPTRPAYARLLLPSGELKDKVEWGQMMKGDTKVNTKNQNVAKACIPEEEWKEEYFVLRDRYLAFINGQSVEEDVDTTNYKALYEEITAALKEFKVKTLKYELIEEEHVATLIGVVAPDSFQKLLSELV